MDHIELWVPKNEARLAEIWAIMSEQPEGLYSERSEDYTQGNNKSLHEVE